MKIDSILLWIYLLYIIFIMDYHSDYVSDRSSQSKALSIQTNELLTDDVSNRMRTLPHMCIDVSCHLSPGSSSDPHHHPHNYSQLFRKKSHDFKFQKETNPQTSRLDSSPNFSPYGGYPQTKPYPGTLISDSTQHRRQIYPLSYDIPPRGQFSNPNYVHHMSNSDQPRFYPTESYSHYDTTGSDLTSRLEPDADQWKIITTPGYVSTSPSASLPSSNREENVIYNRGFSWNQIHPLVQAKWANKEAECLDALEEDLLSLANSLQEKCSDSEKNKEVHSIRRGSQQSSTNTLVPDKLTQVIKPVPVNDSSPALSPSLELNESYKPEVKSDDVKPDKVSSTAIEENPDSSKSFDNRSSRTFPKAQNQIHSRRGLNSPQICPSPCLPLSGEDPGDQWSIHSQIANNPIRSISSLNPTHMRHNAGTKPNTTSNALASSVQNVQFNNRSPFISPIHETKVNLSNAKAPFDTIIEEEPRSGSASQTFDSDNAKVISEHDKQMIKPKQLSSLIQNSNIHPTKLSKLKSKVQNIMTANKFVSQQQTELLIKALEALRDSVEQNNMNLELELQQAELSMRHSGLSCHADPGFYRTSMLSGRTGRNRGYSSRYSIASRHEHGRKSVGHRRSEDFSQNRAEKVAVEVRVVFLKIGEIDTLKEYYYADAFLQAKWREPKLDGRTTEELSITELEQYWNPLLYIDNILSETKETQWLMAQKNEIGEVVLMERRRIKGVFLETLELNDFPLDVQDLTITVTTERPETEVDIIPDQVEMSAINIQTFVDQQEWKLHEHVEITKRIIKQEYSSSMKSHPCLSVTCRAARRPGYFYWNVFLIMFMISGLAFATFAVSPDKAELRLRLSFTLILTSVTFKYVITQSLPKISYLTYMDKYVLMSLAILCIISIWHAVVTFIEPEIDFGAMVKEKVVPRANVNSGNISSSSSSIWKTPIILLKDHGTNKLNETIFQANNSSIDEQNSTSSVPYTIFNTTTLAPSNASVPNNTTPSWFSTTKLLINESDHVNQSNPIFDMNFKSEAEYASKKLQDQGCSRTNRMACPDWQVVKQIEQHVFTSFVIIYVLAHAIFIFWLYFDASRRRREMQQKDRDYRSLEIKPTNFQLLFEPKAECKADVRV